MWKMSLPLMRRVCSEEPTKGTQERSYTPKQRAALLWNSSAGNLFINRMLSASCDGVACRKAGKTIHPYQ